MNTPYGLRVIESCLNCPLLKDRFLCDLPRAALEKIDAISSSATYPKGAILFVEGQEPRGVFIVCNGRVKLTASASDGKSIILRIAGAGEVVGLPGTISGKPYGVTAEALEPTQANFMPRAPFLQMLREHGEAALRVAEIMSDIYHAAYKEVRYLGLSSSAEAKVARFLLDLTAEADQTHGQIRTTLLLTHGEIAEMIGASRETVTRVFADFKRRGLVDAHGSTLLILNKSGLQALL